MGEVENKKIVLRGYVDGNPVESDLVLKCDDKIKLQLPSQSGSAAVILKNLYLSCDPYMRGRMHDFHASYIPAFLPGNVIEGFGVSKVLASDNPDFKPGDIVASHTVRWEEYSIVQKPVNFRKIKQADDIPLSYHIGLLGMPGFTAYVGFYEICAPKKGESIYVSAASGAVGQIVGQLAKLYGCYVVGSAGSAQKVDLLKNKFGYDEAFNYKEEPDLDKALKRYFPEGIDMYFENVGGAMLDAVLPNMRVHGRIAVCGMVAQQSHSDRPGIYNLSNLIIKRVTMKGFLQSDYLHLYPRFLEAVLAYYRDGKIAYVENVNHGLESAPAAFVALFSGKNVGKQVVCIAPE